MSVHLQSSRDRQFFGGRTDLRNMNIDELAGLERYLEKVEL